MATADFLRHTSPALGFWCSTGHPGVIDAAGAESPDWMCIDAQHGIDLGRLDASPFTVLASYGVPSFVRVPALDAAAIGRALDLGANGIIVPLVNSASDARAAVAATRHAPRGVRSFGMQTRRVGPFDERPYVVIQIETAGSITEVAEIAAVDGVDCLYIGPADLGLAMGGTPAPDVNTIFDGSAPNAGPLGEALEAVLKACEATGAAAGLHCGDGVTAARAVRRGFGFCAVSADLGLVASGLTRDLAEARLGA